ncbi:YdcH family protein [Acidimangrovimonas sediminis]|uniref:YdcH family protein n=1 Tax=Acidimangrovimonas sediminis TaxID=2056283 RepID=UPI000C7FA2E4|nr:DUF465 domain-containing protein [Acidimangrovimonas sediminis]
MAHTPHALAEDFPEAADRIAALKAANAHFARLVEEYQEVNQAVHTAETLAQPTAEEHEAELRRKRMQLKDEIWKMLQEA